MIKRLALAVCLALTFCNNNSGAATETVTLEFPEERAAEFDELVDEWLRDQKNADGSLRYPQDTAKERKQALLQFILKFDYIQVVLKACDRFPDKCPEDMKILRETRNETNQKYQDLLNSLVK